jgi:hypothetical protein
LFKLLADTSTLSFAVLGEDLEKTSLREIRKESSMGLVIIHDSDAEVIALLSRSAAENSGVGFESWLLQRE